MLADFGDRTKTECDEQFGELLGRYVPRRDRHFDLAPRLGRRVELRTLVSHVVLLSHLAGPQRFVRLCKVTGGVIEIAIDLELCLAERSAECDQPRRNAGQIRDAKLLFDFDRHEWL